MFVGLFARRQPKKYREEIRSEIEICGAICRVKVLIHFLEKWHLKETEIFVNGKPMAVLDHEYQKDDWYGFMVEVELSKEEYLEHRKNLEEYACSRAREEKRYKVELQDCIEKCANGRNYEVEEILPRDDFQSVELQWKKREWKEYVPVY